MPQGRLKARMTYQTCLPASLRTRLDAAAGKLNMSLNAYVASLLAENVKARPRIESDVKLVDEPMCKPFSLRLPPATMLVIQDGALQANRKINTEIILRVSDEIQTRDGSAAPLYESPAWVRLSAAIDALSLAGSVDLNHLAELDEAKLAFEGILSRLGSTHSRSGLFGEHCEN